MMDIVHCIDNGYVAQCGVTMTSVCLNNMDNMISFHILTNNLSPINRNLLEKTVNGYGKDITFYDVDEQILSKCPIRKGDHVSIATYFRIMIPLLLPKDLDKVLYLDCDLIVRGDLSSLWDVDVSNDAIAAVPDCFTDSVLPYNYLEYDRHLGYFNAGVLLFNLDCWRKNDVTSAVFRFIQDNPEKLKFWDQDALNYVLKNLKVRLPLKYNVQERFWDTPSVFYRSFCDELEEAKRNPLIFHFVAPVKPWHKECTSFMKKEYFYYLRKTEWRSFTPNYINFKSMIFYLLYKYFGVKIARVTTKKSEKSVVQALE